MSTLCLSVPGAYRSPICDLIRHLGIKVLDCHQNRNLIRGIRCSKRMAKAGVQSSRPSFNSNAYSAFQVVVIAERPHDR